MFLPALTPDDWPAVSALLDEALALPESERDTFVQALAGERAAYRDTLRALLAQAAGVETGEFLATLPRFTLLNTSGASIQSDALDELAAGATIGPYRLLSELGSGGMGAVWLAERADRTLKRKVALKLPRLAWARGLAERMARERDILATLEHPNIARLHDAGVTDGGLPYLAMEYIEGEPIDAYCDRNRLDLRARLVLFRQVLGAVQYAHANLVIHRDLKPSNILVTAEGQARLLDFGIAKLLDSGQRALETALTQMAGRALTPDFASPEQIRGELLSTASDVYSLGVLLYLLLTGERPYRLKVQSAAQLEQAILSAEPPRASGVVSVDAARLRGTTERRLARALAGDLDTIVGKALAKLPAHRYDTAAALAQDLERHLHGRPIVARPVSAWRRLVKLVQRNRLAAGAVAAVIVALAAGLVAALWQASVAREQARFAQQASGRHEGVRQFYAEVLTAVAGWDAKQFAEPGSIVKLIGAKLTELEPQYKARQADWAGILNAALVLYNFLGEPEESLKVSRRYLEVLESSRADLRSVVLAHMSIARNLGLIARYDESEMVLRQALERVPDSSDPAQATLRLSVLGDLGQLLSRLARRAEAKAVFEEGQRIGQRSGLQNRDFAGLLQSFGNLEAGLDSAAALAALETSNRVYLSNRDTEGAELSLNRMYLGAAQMELGRLDQAVKTLRESLAASVQDYGITDSQAVNVAGLLALALTGDARHAEADEVVTQSLSALQDKNEPRHRAMRAVLIGRRVQAALAAGDLAAAEAALQPRADLEAHDPQVTNRHVLPLARVELLLAQRRPREAGEVLEGFRAIMAGKGRLTERFLTSLADVHVQRALGDGARAARIANELVRAMSAEGAIASWLYISAHEWAALTAAEIGEVDSARSLLQTALDLQARVSAPSAVERADSELRQAKAWALLGDDQRARAAAQAALERLNDQRPTSPRLAEARRLAAAAR